MAASGNWFGPTEKALTRRTAIGLAVGAGAMLCAPAIAQARAKVVVIGGGAGGATAARHIARNNPQVAVTLITAEPRYTSCFFSNLYLAGLRSLRSITHDLNAMAQNNALRLRAGTAVAIDRDRRVVRLSNGAEEAYDRLVLSPGVSFKTDAIEGYDAEAMQSMPHAYAAGVQTYELRRQLLAMRPGGLCVVAPPQNPYRCPPGPYERVSMIANLFRRMNPTAKILVLDAKDAFAKQELFLDGWRRSYGDMVEWTPAAKLAGGVERVDARTKLVKTKFGDEITADVVNIIPPQQAGRLARQAELTDGGDWAPIEPTSMRSTLDPNIYIVGDAAAAAPMPKSGFAANSQAHVAAFALRADLDGKQPFPAKFRNTCWSFIDYQNVVKIGANYAVRDGRLESFAGFKSALDDTETKRLENTFEANSWYVAMTEDMYG